MALFKRKRKKLDIPPPPPTLDIPPHPDELDLPELPELPPLPEIMHEAEHPSFPENIPKPPEIKPFKEEHISVKPIPKPPEIKEEVIKTPKHEEREETIVKQQKFHSIGKEMFIKADRYKGILESVGVTKRKLRESEKILERLNEIKNTKDKEFEKWRILLEDIERKSVYIDKTLFER